MLYMVCSIVRPAYSSEVAGVTYSAIYGMYHCEISIFLRCSRIHKQCYGMYPGQLAYSLDVAGVTDYFYMICTIARSAYTSNVAEVTVLYMLCIIAKSVYTLDLVEVLFHSARDKLLSQLLIT